MMGGAVEGNDEADELMRMAIRIATIQALMSIEGTFSDKYGLRATTHKLIDGLALELERQRPLTVAQTVDPIFTW